MNELNRNQSSTIVALASAIGGGIAVLRISGKEALKIANKVWKGNKLLSYKTRRQFLYGQIINGDEAMAVYMPKPYSYTAEDVVELQCHGGQCTVQDTLKKILQAGAISAEAGEFTKRAFLNGRLDLTQAEAVLELITAKSETMMRLALQQLDGRLGNNLDHLYLKLIELHSEIEVRLDFIDEDLNWISKEEIKNLLKKINQKLKKILKNSKNSQILREGIKVIIAGSPNTGKSSFLNHILGYNRAIVTDIKGTTRDTIEEQVLIRNIPVRIMDTAGIRKSNDIVEKTGIKRSFQALQLAEVIFWLIDCNCDLSNQLPPKNLSNRSMIILLNKVDLLDNNKYDISPLKTYSNFIFKVSVKKDFGFKKCYDAFEKIVLQGGKNEAMEYILNTRHVNLLNLVLELLEDCKKVLKNEEWELLAINLKASLNNLGEILGKTIQPDILHNIFAKYCIGK